MLRSSVPSGKISKVIVCGYQSSGKTSILEQLIYGKINPNIHSTIEDVYCAHIDNDRGGKEKVRFYDTAGMNSTFHEVPRAYLPYADGFVLVYAINNMESFTLLEQIKRDIDKNREKKEISIIVLGNKLDLQNERQVDLNIAVTWAQKEKVKLFEVTAKDRKSLIEPFIYITSKMNPPPSKSTFPQLSRKNKPGNITLEL